MLTRKALRGRGLKGAKINRGLVWMVAAMLGLSGCAGAVLESQNHNGQKDRLRVETENWETFDARRMSPKDANGFGDYSIMLKGEKSF
jgi:hypothetical protein